MPFRSVITATSLVLVMLCATSVWAEDRRADRVDRRDRHRNPTVVVHWNEATLEEIRSAVPKVIGPPIAARALAIAHTCMYDAWAPYDRKAIGTVLGDSFRRPARERTDANKAIAISVAAHRCLANLFADEKTFPPPLDLKLFPPAVVTVPPTPVTPSEAVGRVMARLNAALAAALAKYAPGASDEELTAAAAVGEAAAQAVIDFRANDGANQHANMPNTKTTPGKPLQAYSDWGFLPELRYTPVNISPMEFCQPNVTNCPPLAPLVDMNRWQPLIGPPPGYTLGGPVLPPDVKGSVQTFIGCHFENVTPFALRSSNQFDHLRRADPPDVHKSPELYRRNVEEVLQYSASLNDEKKLIVEYWADGPSSELPPGHWGLFAQFVSQRDKHKLDDDVKMFFAMHNASFDAGIVAWHFKRLYDGVRPITAIRYLMQGQQVLAWAGPGSTPSTQLIPGEKWSPYNPGSNLTPAFPGYISGHSAFSAAAAAVLREFTGSDHFGFSTIVPKGFGRAENPATHPIPPVDTKISYKTFSDAADAAALSRILGGIHFMDDNTTGLFLGELIGRQAWEKATEYFNGTASNDRRPRR